ncbi:MAG: hypothetical protein JO022_19270 [Acidobacteriaceae bacterium]|nr:hypothetical protein [Acidobacteriaceae bacterium]
MFALKPLSHESVASALAKAEHYRLLNEAAEAESICRDILDIEPSNQRALVCLILSLSDQISHDRHAFTHAEKLLQQLEGEYERAYFGGILWERRAKARHHEPAQGARHTVYEWMVRALQNFEVAEHLRPSGNDDALLRWNTCVRYLNRHRELTPAAEDIPAPILSE